MISILWASSDETFKYAAEELKKYLDLVTSSMNFARLCRLDALPEKIAHNTIHLGTLDELSLKSDDVSDPSIDDVEDVSVINGTGYIAGSNPRSVLFGIYDYFKSGGCNWVRPGRNGEHIEHFDPHDHSFVYRKKADLPFRGECLEGASKYEHVRAVIEWSPKVHMNLFMIQGITPYNFLSRWYKHEYNRVIPSEDIGYEATRDMVSCIERDVRRCGLQLHAMGHCYQTEPYGIHYKTSFDEYEMNPEMEEALALVDGKREFRGSPSWSQLCMGNDKVLHDQVKWIADYAESKPHIGFLHIWLGDGRTNHCECELCTPHHPSDLYIKMLNMLDGEFTKRGLATKIVFISYTDTLWAPQKERFNNPSRFIMTSAMGGRDYNIPYDGTEYEGELPKWIRNNYDPPKGFPMLRKMLNGWKPVYDGLNFIFEYRFYVQHYNDIGSMRTSELYYKDLKALRSLGFSGMMNCQTQRASFPSSFPVMLCGEVMFDLDKSYEELYDSYFKNAYGEKYREVAEYLEELSRLYHYDIINSFYDVAGNERQSTDTWFNNPLLAEDLSRVPEKVDAFLESIKDVKYDDPSRDRSYQLLRYHGQYCKMLSNVMLAAASGDRDEAKHRLDDMSDYFSRIECEIDHEFDLFLFMKCYNRKLQ